MIYGINQIPVPELSDIELKNIWGRLGEVNEECIVNAVYDRPAIVAIVVQDLANEMIKRGFLKVN